MEGSLYTFFLDFQGGIYVSQVRAGSPFDAMWAWAHALDTAKIKYMGEKRKQDLLNDLEDDYPHAINDTCNVWSFAVIPHGRFGLVNLVKTIG